MKLVLASLLALVSTAAFAGTEVHYLVPFQSSISFLKSSDIREIQIADAMLVNAPTKIALDYSGCELEDSHDKCPATTVLESKKAVKVEISYKNPTASDQDGPAYQELYLNPARLSPATLAILQSHRSLGSEANKVFALKTQEVMAQVQVVDDARTSICENEGVDGCTSKMVYKPASASKIMVSVQARQ